MGIKERQERDREAVRRSILDAARELFVAEGFQNVSIRKIAERIEYSPAAIYGYFPSKDDIFFELAEEGLRLLGDPGAIRDDPRFKDAPPLARVRAVFWRLYEFSREQPQYFALIFVQTIPVANDSVLQTTTRLKLNERNTTRLEDVSTHIERTLGLLKVDEHLLGAIPLVR